MILLTKKTNEIQQTMESSEEFGIPEESWNKLAPHSNSGSMKTEVKEKRTQCQSETSLIIVIICRL